MALATPQLFANTKIPGSLVRPNPMIKGAAVAPVPGAVTQAAPGTFDASTNLIGSQLSRTPTARQDRYQSLTDTAATNATGYDRAGAQSAATALYGQQFGTGATAYQAAPTNVAAGAAVDPAQSAALARYQQLTQNSAENVANSPDRVAMAQQAWDTAAKAGAPQYEHDLNQATKLAAAHGGLGSGMLSNDYGTIANNRALQLDTSRDQLLQQAVSDSINDRYTQLNALSGLQGQQYGQDASTRGEQRTERDYTTGLATDNLNRGTAERNYAAGLDQSNQSNAFQRQQAALGAGATDAAAGQNDRYQALNTLSGLEGTEYNRSGDTLTNLQGERGYQSGLSQQATQNSIAQYLAEQQAQNQNFQQGLQLDQLGNRATGNATAAYQNAANYYGNDASSSFGGLAAQLGQDGAAGSTQQQQQLIQQLLAAIQSGKAA